MRAVNLMPLLAVVFDSQVVRVVVWTGLVGLTIALLVLMRTRWGQSQPLRKCIVLSLLAHLLLGIYTTTVTIVSEAIGPGDGLPLRVSLLTTGPDGGDSDTNTDPQPWEQLADVDAEKVYSPLDPGEISPAPSTLSPLDAAAPMRLAPAAGHQLPEGLQHATLASATAAVRPGSSPAARIEAPPAQRSDPAPTRVAEPSATNPPASDTADAPPTRASAADPQPAPLDPLGPLPGEVTAPPATGSARPAPAALAGAGAGDAAPSAGDAASARTTPSAIPGVPEGSVAVPGVEFGPSIASLGPAPIARAATDEEKVPSIYQLRLAPDHTRQALAHGGTRETEAAVVAALRWLAAHQSPDGRWDGQRLEAGREAAIDGQERRGAGSRADTGISGLALLALLASGHTHLEGEHRDTVRRGLEFLLSAQAADGNLGGNATLYEKMYCHAMASFALSEAYAMTHDERLQTAVRRAIGYTLAAQHSATGGWRYQPGEAGDTSQLGWQFMALKSAELAGIPIPPDTRAGMIRYLGSVSSGKHGGLASYRPGHKPSRTMTAEALVCKQFLGMAHGHPAGGEAGNFIQEELPGDREPNFYYWYYATLGTYQLQDEHWQRWNKALQVALVGSQRTVGDKAGSWDPDPVWGAYGGRAYSTALGALCLEVYYRYLPFYVEAAGRHHQPK